MNLSPFLDKNPEVLAALDEGKPIVALESTIISHGMPYPENKQTAQALETLIRDQGAVPATLAILHGRIKIGLTEAELEYLATQPDIEKASRRDLALIISQQRSAATTVAATMILADLAGIRVFATGGIGGVHRGGEQSLDISADLTELSRTRVGVVSAGVKAILDIPRTLEYLETLGVPVIGVGTEDFPAFYTRRSGSKAPYRLDTPQEIAGMMRTQWALGLGGGMLIANPIPEAYDMNADQINAAIEQALEEAAAQQIQGKALTPFLLRRITELTAGASLVSNIELVRHNARLAAQIAIALQAD